MVSPHLDDAVLSTWLALDRRPGVEVVTCFAGFPSEDAAVGSWDVATGGPRGRAAVSGRRQEDLAALSRSRSMAVHLDLPDAQYRRDDVGVVGRLADLLRSRLPYGAEVWLPAGIGGHVDHIYTRDAVLAATGPQHRRMVYADLPYAAQPAWPGQLTGGARDRVVEALVPWLGRDTPLEQWRSAIAAVPGAALEDARLTRLTASQRRAKWAALRCYDSQVDALRCGRRHLLRRRRVFAFEACWPQE